MTPAQVAHIMALVDEYFYAQLKQKREAVEAALRDAPQQAPVVLAQAYRTSAAYDVGYKDGQKSAPVAWMDDFGNAFPLAANKGAGSWMDDHKRNGKPLYTTPSAPTAVEPDEQRYQLLRRGQHWSVIDGVGDVLRGDDLDAAVDSILAARLTKDTP